MWDPVNSVWVCDRCGHTDDEHARTGFFKPCQVPWCDCDDLEK